MPEISHLVRRGRARIGALAMTSLGMLLLAAPVAPATARSVSAPMQSSLEAQAAMFVIDRFLDHENDLEAIKRFYGESVFYFREGVQSREEVLRDKKAYLQRWPRRRFDPDLETLRTRLIEGPDGRRDVEVKLEVDFEVSSSRSRASSRRAARDFTGDSRRPGAYDDRNARRVSRGRSMVVIVLAQRAEGFIVLSEGGQVIRRR